MVAPLVVLQMRKLALIHGKPFEFDRCSQSLAVSPSLTVICVEGLAVRLIFF